MISPKHLLKKAALAPLRIEPVRSRIAFWLNQQHYPELDIRVPLSHGLFCPIYSPEFWCSFSEIFVNAEYAPALDRMALPNRWLDLGCHAGFFSLYLEWRRRKAGLTDPAQCLLVDADACLEQSVTRLAAANHLPFRFLHGGIGPGGSHMAFTKRSFMASSASNIDADGGVQRSIPVLRTEQLEAAFPGSLDLVKVDIEGSEYDLLENYAALLARSRFLLLEWHSWHRGGGGQLQLIERACAHGFKAPDEITHAHEVAPGKQCGVLLFEKARPAVTLSSP